MWCHEITQSANKITSADLGWVGCFVSLPLMFLLWVFKSTLFSPFNPVYIIVLFVPWFLFPQNPGSPSDSSTLSGSLDFSYSPAHLPSYTPENYNPTPSLDTRNCGYPSEDYTYPHLPSHAQYDCFFPAPTSGCYCVSCEAEHLATISASEYFSCPSTDCVNLDPSAAAGSDFYLRETNCDVCYSS